MIITQVLLGVICHVMCEGKGGDDMVCVGKTTLITLQSA